MTQQLVNVGTKVLTKSGTKVVAEVGQFFCFGIGDLFIPVKFEGSEYAILFWQAFVEVLSVWVPDGEQGVEEIKNSSNMPIIDYSPEDNTVFCICNDNDGNSLITLYKDAGLICTAV